MPSVDNIFGGRVFYDSLNRLTRRDGQASLEQALYAYDAAGQLLQACAKVTGGCQNEYGVVANVTVPSYTYDAAGNRTDSAAAAIVGAGNRLLRFKGDTLTYDADGNIATKVGHGKSWSYTWDGYDRLTDVYESGVLVMHMGYDAFDRRIATSNNNSCSGQRHIWDGDQFALATNCNGVVVDEYGWYPGSEQLLGAKFAGRTGVVMTDHALGSSVLGVVDADSSANPLIKAYNTTAWGESPADTGAVFRLRMAAQQYDQTTGLYYMRARFYDPEVGRFISEDPVGTSGGLNLYAYSLNDPINRSDPSGQDPTLIPCTTPNNEPGLTDRDHPTGCIPTTPIILAPIYVPSDRLSFDPLSPVPWALGAAAAPSGGQALNAGGFFRSGCDGDRVIAALICFALPTQTAVKAIGEGAPASLAALEALKPLEEEEAPEEIGAALEHPVIARVIIAGGEILLRIMAAPLSGIVILCPGCTIMYQQMLYKRGPSGA